MIIGDSWDYDLIYKGVELSKDAPGICLEIGLRLGGGTKEIIDAIHDTGTNKVSVALDPYGSILYEHKQDHFVRLDYDENMKAECLKDLYPYAQSKGVHFIFINLEDSEFFDKYKDGVPVYRINKEIQNQYSFVHFDGPHSVEPIKAEIDFFLPRIQKGACFCFDDISLVDTYYDHTAIDVYLKEKGFKVIELRDKKGLYQYEN